jgi:hypothetical protein
MSQVQRKILIFNGNSGIHAFLERLKAGTSSSDFCVVNGSGAEYCGMGAYLDAGGNSNGISIKDFWTLFIGGCVTWIAEAYPIDYQPIYRWSACFHSWRYEILLRMCRSWNK